MNSVQYLRTGPLAPRIRWQVATVRDLREETAETRTLVLDVPDWRGHLAGQHVDVRLTAEDGYQAERSYSIASAPEAPDLELTIEDEPGFWEAAGYHNRGDPWHEQRYWGD